MVQREKLRNSNSSRIQELASSELPLWRGFCDCFLALVSICISPSSLFSWITENLEVENKRLHRGLSMKIERKIRGKKEPSP